MSYKKQPESLKFYGGEGGLFNTYTIVGCNVMVAMSPNEAVQLCLDMLDLLLVNGHRFDIVDTGRHGAPYEPRYIGQE